MHARSVAQAPPGDLVRAVGNDQDPRCAGDRTSDGSELYFCSERKLAKGDSVRLAADPSRVLVYVGDVP